MFSNKRDKDFIFPRHVAMYLLKDRLGLSLNQIGKIFSKDHTTVIYAVEKVKKQLRSKDHFASLIANISK
jgi:chromosomal replication initiator protein